MLDNKIKYHFWLPGLVGKICIFLFAYITLVFLLFLLGNFQNFMDSTEIMLLKLLEVSSLFFLLSAVYYGVLIIWLGMRLKKLKYMHLVLIIISLILVFLVYLITKFILSWIFWA